MQSCIKCFMSIESDEIRNFLDLRFGCPPDEQLCSSKIEMEFREDELYISRFQQNVDERPLSIFNILLVPTSR